MARALGIIGLGLAAMAAGQNPDVRFRFDLAPTYRTDSRGLGSLRLYDPLGRYSTFGISLLTEIGFRVVVAQRLARIGNEADRSGIDVGYVEDEGLWRVGKQYVPFGSGRMIRESLIAARGDTDLFIEGFPIAAALADGGAGQARGFSARVGSRIGFSVAIGEHWGSAATSFTPIRRPEESGGRGSGYRLLLGVDAARKIGSFEAFGDLVIARQGQTPNDPDRFAFELGGSFRLPNRSLVVASYARDSATSRDFFRLSGAFPVERRATLEPFLRVSEGRLFDLALTLRIRF